MGQCRSGVLPVAPRVYIRPFRGLHYLGFLVSAGGGGLGVDHLWIPRSSCKYTFWAKSAIAGSGTNG